MTTTVTTPSPTTVQDSALDMPTLVQEGSRCLEKGDLPGALACFQKVVEAFPQRPEGHNNLGALYSSLGEHAKAEACFDTVIALLPDNPGLYYNRGMARSSQEKFDTAREDFHRVLEYDSKDTDCLNNLGVMDFMQGRFESAREYFSMAMDIRPDYDRALLNLCDLEIAAGNGPLAIQLCEDFLRTHNSTEVKRALLTMLSTGCREALDKAGQTARSLMGQDDNDPEIRGQLVRIQKAQKVLDGAVMDEMPMI